MQQVVFKRTMGLELAVKVLSNMTLRFGGKHQITVGVDCTPLSAGTRPRDVTFFISGVDPQILWSAVKECVRIVGGSQEIDSGWKLESTAEYSVASLGEVMAILETLPKPDLILRGQPGG